MELDPLYNDQLILVFGGISEEHRVSVASAVNICSVLPNCKPHFISRQGEVFVVTHSQLLEFKDPFLIDFNPSAAPDYSNVTSFLDQLEINQTPDTVVVIGLHGASYEDGTFQKLLEDRNIKFTGSGSLTSLRAFNKSTARRVANDNGINVASAVEIAASTSLSDIALTIKDFVEIHQKAVAKPLSSGSSYGLLFVDGDSSFEEVAKAIINSGCDYLLEQFIQGREFTIGVVDDGKNCIALPATEIVIDSGGSFNFEAKYLGVGAKEITPAEVDELLAYKLSSTVLKIHSIFNCRGCTRSDFIWDGSNLFFLEVNTLPGLTSSSLIPQQLDAAGYKVEQLVRWLINVAIELN